MNFSESHPVLSELRSSSSIMVPDRFSAFMNSAEDIRLVSTDVFDTLLLRTTASARSRLAQGEKLFGKLLASRGERLEPTLLLTCRLEAERLAFRALDLAVSGEVRLSDIIERQLRLLGLPNSLVEARLAIEVEVEKASLVANRALAGVLRSYRRPGRCIVAVSDTTLSSEHVQELIRHFHGPDLIDQVYTSAECGRTKRSGELFLHVATTEQVPLNRILHIGDDLQADLRSASARGVMAVHAPRPTFLSRLRKANGAAAATKFLLSQRKRLKGAMVPENPRAFGYSVLGPIVTQFSLLTWLYASEAATHEKAILLFCARGGIGIREAFERVLAGLSLPLDLPRENILISRLVAARAALLVRSVSAVEEIAREFQGRPFRDVANALGGRPYKLPKVWHEPFRSADFLDLLFADPARELLSDIRRQNALFERHFAEVRDGATRVILCDTGLYGSTQRLLQSALPELRIETVQFARANYKGHSEDHFNRVAGLMVERNRYSPVDVRSCVLRYWHLIESLFEPCIPSVRSFSELENGRVTGNCGDIRFGIISPAQGNRLLSEALEYIEDLPRKGPAAALADAEVAWFRLKKAITRPSLAELQCLEVPDRSVDFGRPDVRRVTTAHEAKSLLRRLALLRSELWREGAITREFPLLKHALLPLLDSIHSLRSIAR